MLSRVANSIYWLKRYIERAENVARFIDAVDDELRGRPVKADQTTTLESSLAEASRAEPIMASSPRF